MNTARPSSVIKPHKVNENGPTVAVSAVRVRLLAPVFLITTMRGGGGGPKEEDIATAWHRRREAMPFKVQCH